MDVCTHTYIHRYTQFQFVSSDMKIHEMFLHDQDLRHWCQLLILVNNVVDDNVYFESIHKS